MRLPQILTQTFQSTSSHHFTAHKQRCNSTMASAPNVTTLFAALALLLAVAAQTASAQQPTLTYQGCVLNKDPTCYDRPLPFLAESSAAMTIERCRAHAEARLATAFGVEYGKECWLDPTNAPLTELTRLGPSTACTMPCTGGTAPANATTCGGLFSVDLYTFTLPAAAAQLAPFTPQPLGCFRDDQLARRMRPLWVQAATMSVALCAHVAHKEGVPCFALQAGTECWGGYDLEQAQSLGNSTACNAPCPRDASETCGGLLALSLYAHPDLVLAASPAPPTPTPTPTGATGATGATGSTGASGPSGGAGTGSTDETGAVGATGAVGEPLLQVSDPLAQVGAMAATGGSSPSPSLLTAASSTGGGGSTGGGSDAGSRSAVVGTAVPAKLLALMALVAGAGVLL